MRWICVIVGLLSCCGCYVLSRVPAWKIQEDQEKIFRTYDYLDKTYSQAYLGKTKDMVLLGMQGEPVSRYVEPLGFRLQVFPGEEIFEDGERRVVVTMRTIPVTENWGFRITMLGNRFVPTTKETDNQFSVRFFFYNETLVLVR